MFQMKRSRDWGYTVRSNNNCEVVLEVFIPVRAVPSRYSIAIRNKKKTFFEVEAPVFLLFNPWCKGPLNILVFSIMWDNET